MSNPFPSIRMVVDTSSNVPDALLAQYNMIEVAAIVNFGTDSYLNKAELKDDEFYRMLAEAEEIPTTSQPTPAQFAAAYAQAFEEGAEHIVLVTVSSKLSGTYASAVSAADEFGKERFTLWDSLSASIGGGMQAIAGARAIAAGADVAGVEAAMQEVQSSTYALLTVETLKYLAKSGRVSNLRAGVGDLLGVKPILTLEDGLLIHASQARGRKRSKKEILGKMAERFAGQPVLLAVAHSNILAEAEAYLAELGTALTIEESHIVDIGPAIGSLAGPGVLAVLAHPVMDPATFASPTLASTESR